MSRLPRTVSVGTLAVIALIAGACASGGAPMAQGDPFDGSGGRSALVTLIVQNRNFSDARLYAIRRGGRKQLGVVGGKQDARFTLDWPVPETLQIEINMLAGPHCYTREMEVDPGDIVELQIDIAFSQTSACR